MKMRETLALSGFLMRDSRKNVTPSDLIEVPNNTKVAQGWVDVGEGRFCTTSATSTRR